MGIDPVEGGQQHKGHFYHCELVREDLPACTSSGSWAQLTGVPEEAVQQHAEEAPIGSQTQGVDGL